MSRDAPPWQLIGETVCVTWHFGGSALWCQLVPAQVSVHQGGHMCGWFIGCYIVAHLICSCVEHFGAWET